MPHFPQVTGSVHWRETREVPIDHTGAVTGRFRPRTEPEAAELVAAIEAALPA
ncbi:hypothetical protein SNOUR_34950 [Streptomyces noursei ATCC 11455]|nr:hypothetical protein SNOUR_34950 [Streptomyces noursei ATCC 11455]